MEENDILEKLRIEDFKLFNIPLDYAQHNHFFFTRELTPEEQRTVDTILTQNRAVDIQWTRVRFERNELLYKSDWTQIADNSLTEEERIQWKEYRQQLRDITTLFTSPFDVIYPTPPTTILG